MSDPDMDRSLLDPDIVCEYCHGTIVFDTCDDCSYIEKQIKSAERKAYGRTGSADSKRHNKHPKKDDTRKKKKKLEQQ